MWNLLIWCSFQNNYRNEVSRIPHLWLITFLYKVVNHTRFACFIFYFLNILKSYLKSTILHDFIFFYVKLNLYIINTTLHVLFYFLKYWSRILHKQLYIFYLFIFVKSYIAKTPLHVLFLKKNIVKSYTKNTTFYFINFVIILRACFI